MSGTCTCICNCQVLLTCSCTCTCRIWHTFGDFLCAYFIMHTWQSEWCNESHWLQGQCHFFPSSLITVIDSTNHASVRFRPSLSTAIKNTSNKVCNWLLDSYWINSKKFMDYTTRYMYVYVHVSMTVTGSIYLWFASALRHLSHELWTFPCYQEQSWIPSVPHVWGDASSRPPCSLSALHIS